MNRSKKQKDLDHHIFMRKALGEFIASMEWNENLIFLEKYPSLVRPWNTLLMLDKLRWTKATYVFLWCP